MNLIGSAKRRSNESLERFFPAVPAEGAVLPHRARSLEDFAEELKVVLDNQQLPTRAVDWIFRNYHVQAQPHPNCQGSIATQTLTAERLVRLLRKLSRKTQQH